MSTYRYATEKISKAVYELAAKEGSLKERMKRALSEQIFAPLQDLPKDEREDLESLRKDMGTKDTLDGMSSEQLEKLADRMLGLLKSLLRKSHEQR
jgi:hypothetical protein